MRDSFIVYRSFYEAIKELPKENQAEVWQAIHEYALNFKKIKLSGISKTIFTLIEPQLESNIRRYKSGGLGGKQTSSKRVAKEQQESSKTVANVNVNVNDNASEPLRGFDLFWKTYPKKKSKGTAIKAWKKLKIQNELFQKIMKSLNNQKNSLDWQKDNGQFIPYPASWLNAMGWENEIEISQPEKTEIQKKAEMQSFYAIGAND